MCGIVIFVAADGWEGMKFIVLGMGNGNAVEM
jgi:hypothetical protein